MNSPEEILLETTRFRVTRATHVLSSGKQKSRAVIRHPGSVVIVPSLANQRVCLIRNHRVAVGSTLIELPAGTLEQGEDPTACARRELKEETGYQAASMKHLTSFFAAPGILDELMHLFFADGLTAGDPCREEGEEIENLILSWDDALSMVQDGTIRDAKTMLGILLCHPAAPRTD